MATQKSKHSFIILIVQNTQIVQIVHFVQNRKTGKTKYIFVTKTK